jgi:hypothetical protein
MVVRNWLLRITGVLWLVASLVFSGPSVSQGQQEDPAAKETTLINPRVDNCNVTDPSIPRPDSITPRIDTTITSDFLTHALLPCAAKTVAPIDLANLQHGFDFYSWLTFLALNSPADGTPIGKVDASTKWERFKPLPDVMHLDGSAPQLWQSDLTKENFEIPAVCRDLGGQGKLVVHMEAIETYSQPFDSGPLIDQNGRYALFGILMNKTMFDYITINRLYSKAGQQNFKHGNEQFSGSSDLPDPVNPGDAGVVNFPNGSISSADATPVAGPIKTKPGTVGSVMIKAAWKQLDAGETKSGKFHTINAFVYSPQSNPPCSIQPLGLIGFHVGHKTVDRHQWIWTTFEHVDNVPEQDDVVAGRVAPNAHYNFYNPSCKQDGADCPVNQTPPRPWDPATQPFPGGFKSQIIRTIAVVPDVKTTLNAKFRALLAGTVWENYMLVSTQWPADFQCAKASSPKDQLDPTCLPAPTFLANTTLETFSQGTAPVSSSSCIACHNNATTRQEPATASDFTYMLEKAH